MSKNFKLKESDIKPLIPPMGGCTATDKITVEGMKVGFFYREDPRFDQDSGWRMMSGTETQEYINDSSNTAIYDLNTIANYDPAIIAFLDFPVGSEFERKPGTDIFKLI